MGNLMIMSVPDAFAWLGAQAYAIGWRVVLLLLAIAVIDYAYQRYEFEKSIRMGKQEIKDELKRTEGNPLIKSKIKERQRALATRRMIQRVPTADVVITNPTHYAVALKYSPETMDAPCVIAKGVDRIAQNIKRVAAEHGVVLVENRPLAQALYKTVDVDQAIPPALFQAVAEVLAYVYRLKKKM
jgi:flagellar biosynthetic protein FlhB